MNSHKKLFFVLLVCSLANTTIVMPVSGADESDELYVTHPGTIATGKPSNSDIANNNLIFVITNKREMQDCQARELIGPQTSIYDPKKMCPSAPISRIDWSLFVLLRAIPNFLMNFMSGDGLEVITSVIRAYSYLVTSASVDEEAQYTM